MKKSTLFSLVVVFLLIPATLYLGTQMTGRAYYLTSTLITIETMLPFFAAFEHRKPQARELVTIAVMCALSVAARVVIQVPMFKPMLAVIMIAGIALGAQAGFLTGAVSAFASNFFFGQGPWTPWQMMAYGIAGLLSGLLFHKKRPFAGNPWLSSAVLAAYGFFAVLLVVGPLLDSCTLFTVGTALSWKFAAAVYGAGLLPNLLLGLATGVTMLLLSRPLLSKLDRLRLKYGMLDTQ